MNTQDVPRTYNSYRKQPMHSFQVSELGMGLSGAKAILVLIRANGMPIAPWYPLNL